MKEVRRKIILAFVLAFVMLGWMCTTANAYGGEEIALKTESAVLVNGVAHSFHAYNINGNNYFKLRDVAFVLNGTGRQFGLTWDGTQNAIFLTPGQSYAAVGGEMQAGQGGSPKTAVPTNSAVYLNGEKVSVMAYNIDGNNFFKLRDLATQLGFRVDWDEQTRSIGIWTDPQKPVVGIHTFLNDDQAAQMLLDSLESLAEQGINLIVAEVGYNYQYTSHPELGKSDGLSFQYARKVGQRTRELGIRFVPEFPCLGHQSWGEENRPLLAVYPELDETPGKYPNNEGIYCRSWCPLNEKVHPLVFDLLDELMAAFQTDAIHVGLDEVVIIGDEDCPRCKGKDPGELLALEINTLYQHFVGEKGAEMFMWADRLLDGQALGDIYPRWEASYNGTHTALHKIPKDIVLCDWHYDPVQEYRSVQYLTEAGFRVLTTSWNNVEATRDFVQYTVDSMKTDTKVLGHLYTTWGDIENKDLPNWAPMKATIGMLLAN